MVFNNRYTEKEVEATDYYSSFRIVPASPGPFGMVSDSSTKNHGQKKEQCNYTPQAAHSFATILNTIEIMQSLKIKEYKVAICRISTEPKIKNHSINLILMGKGIIDQKLMGCVGWGQPITPKL